VITARTTLYTIQVEGVFNTHPEVFRTALVGINGTRGTKRPVLCVELARKTSRAGQERIRQELLELGRGHSHTMDINEILFHPTFPVDIRHNAKIFREKLAVWAGQRLA
jgi:acyl-coenzyme A synthetase/AMP-(fatty) acid ligase